jgi:hypothetical protein
VLFASTPDGVMGWMFTLAMLYRLIGTGRWHAKDAMHRPCKNASFRRFAL